MATQNSQNNSKEQQPNSLNTKQTIGAGVGILVLLGLLFVGTSLNEPAGAELITDAAKPAQSEYQENASELNYEDAMLKEYENGTLIEFRGKVNSTLEEPVKGEKNIVVDIEKEESSGTNNIETPQVMLIYAEDPAKVEEHQDVHLFGRYIGTVEYETSVGSEREVPAIQVDYLS